MKRLTISNLITAAAFALLCSAPHQGLAQSVEEFYRNKTIEMVIGYGPGGSNDSYARAVANHIGKYIPGNPEVIPVNVPGGGSLLAANHIANIAKGDGTVVGLVASTIPLEAQLGVDNVEFGTKDLVWIGRVASNTNLTFVKAETGVETIEDAVEQSIILAADGASSTIAIYPSLMNRMLGTQFKLVMGYQGTAESMLAMDRGEAEGHSTSLAAVASSRPEWLSDGSVNILVQYGLSRHQALPDVPTAVELLEDPEDIAVMRFILSAVEIGKAVITAPEVPADRVEALRRAFDAMLEDEAFIADLERQRLEITPITGEEISEIVDELAATSPAILEHARDLWPNQ